MSSEVTYRVTTAEDYDLVLDFLRKHFYPGGTSTRSGELLQQDTFDEASKMSYIESAPATCIVAMNGTNQVVGVSICGPKGVDEEQRLIKEAAHIPGTNWEKFLLLYALIERDSKVYEKYNVDKAMHCHLLAVHKEFRQIGIGLQLFKKSMERATELGYTLYTIDCTSTTSAGLAEALNMECVNVCSLENYRSPISGDQVFFPTGEFKVVKTFAKRLP